jgi:hypothetical protein
MTDALTIWRHDLDPRPIINDPYVPPTSTLAGMADRLAAVAKVLATLDNEKSEERLFGLEVAGMAVSFACKVLQHLGLETPNSSPALLNLKMAALVVQNLLAAVNGHLEDRQRAVHAQPEAAAEMVIAPAQPAAAAEGAADQQPAPTKAAGLIIDPNTFTVSYKGQDGFFGNVLAFRLLTRLAESPGVYVALNILKWDVWADEDISDARVQRQISTIRKRLREAEIEGIEIDQKQPHCCRLILR